MGYITRMQKHLGADNSRTAYSSRARDLLQRAGLRATTPRLAVLRELLQTPRPVSHSEVAKELHPQGFDRVTVFRNLHDLAEAGVLSRVDVGDHTWRFELRRDGKRRGARHSHFVCERCNSVSCLTDVNVKVSARAGSNARTIGKVSAIVLRGRCRACAA
jgi:Fur family ferric uptake transcriptional regulator